MTKFGKLGALAAAGVFAGSVASAGTVMFTAIEGSGDTVTFEIMNLGSGPGGEIREISLSLGASDNFSDSGNRRAPRFGGGSDFARNLTPGIDVTVTRTDDTDSEIAFDTPSSTGKARPTDRDLLTFTFGGAGLAMNDAVTFSATTWLQDFALDGQGGISGSANLLEATVVFADGTSTASGFFSEDAAGNIGLKLGGGTSPVTPTPSEVPLPASALLLLGGLAGLGAVRRNKKA